jgi:hypothetical protein
MKIKHALNTILLITLWVSVFHTSHAKTGLYSITPESSHELKVPENGFSVVNYKVTNTSKQVLKLTMPKIKGIEQLTEARDSCPKLFTLPSTGSSCILSLKIDGSKLSAPIMHGPAVCFFDTPDQCDYPKKDHQLKITQTTAKTQATLVVMNSPVTTNPSACFTSSPSIPCASLTLMTNGPSGSLIIRNNSSNFIAYNISSTFTGALVGIVTETGNTCQQLMPNSTCTLTYTPGSTPVAATNFTIQGINTLPITAAIAINAPPPTLSGIINNVTSVASGSTSGGVGVTVTGTNLIGASSLTIGGVAATNLVVVNNTTLNAVTPAHAAGLVDVSVTTPYGSTTLNNAFNYLATVIGQPTNGGKVACLGGIGLDLIASTNDNSTGIPWSTDTVTLLGATSTSNGASNTTIIAASAGGTPVSGAKVCSDYAIDSQGNSPCLTGACYNDWYLPAKDQLNCLHTNEVAIGNFSNADYWSSTEDTAANAWYQVMIGGGFQGSTDKTDSYRVRCVRSFTP